MSGQVPAPDTAAQEVRAALAIVAMRLDQMRRELDTTVGVLAAAVEAAYRQPAPPAPPPPEPADDPAFRAFGDYPDD